MATQTLSVMRQRLQRFESHDNITMSGVTGAIDADINEAQRNLYLKAKFYWQRTEETVVAVAGATEITMASAPKQIRFVIAPDGTFLAARPYNIQEQYAARYLAKGMQTYSVKGVNGNGFIVLGIRKPAQSGDYRIGIIPAVTALTNEDDTPDGPEEVADFIVRYARYLRLAEDEERSGLMDRALRDANDIRAELKAMNGGIMGNLNEGVAGGMSVDA